MTENGRARTALAKYGHKRSGQLKKLSEKFIFCVAFPSAFVQEFCTRTSVDVKLSNELNFNPVSKAQSTSDQKG